MSDLAREISELANPTDGMRPRLCENALRIDVGAETVVTVSDHAVVRLARYVVQVLVVTVTSWGSAAQEPSAMRVFAVAGLPQTCIAASNGNLRRNVQPVGR